VRGITANREALRQSVERSIGIVTALNPYIGYANATAVAQEAHASGRSVYEVVLEKGLLSKEKLEEVLRPEILTRPQPILVSVRTAPDIEGVGSVDIDTDLRVQ
jgi:aspartate ammonia-lyase